LGEQLVSAIINSAIATREIHLIHQTYIYSQCPSPNTFLESSLRPILDPDFIPATRSSELEENFLKDEVRMTLLNPDYEVEIGDSTFTYLSENIVVRRASDNLEAKAIVDNLERGDDSKVPHEMLREEFEILSKKHLIKKEKKVLSEYCEFFFSAVPSVESCMPSLLNLSGLAVVRSHFDPDPLTPLDNYFVDDLLYGEFTIDWGDGSPIQSFFSFGISGYSHTYNQFGTYVITITYNSIAQCHTGSTAVIDETYTIDVNLSPVTCEEPNPNNISQNCYHTSGNYKLRGELWFKDDFLGNHQVAKTTSYKWHDPWLGSPGWQKKRAYVYAKLWYAFRDENCGNLDSGTEIDAAGNQKDIRADKTRSGYQAFIADHEVQGEFEMENDNNERTCESSLQVCD
jgi:hypothetical protein